MIQAISQGCSDRRLYIIYLIETYHYTRHNAKNQALVAVRFEGESNPYFQFCLHHAADEAGHELMALHDLKKLGIDPQAVITSEPLAATEVLIAYLYWISVQGNPYQRLGYSFWAENCYQSIDAVLKAIQKQMTLTLKEMTFFTEHATLDKKHAEMVHQMISKIATTEQTWNDIERVMQRSLMLTGKILDDVYEEYQKLVTRGSSRYSFLE